MTIAAPSTAGASRLQFLKASNARRHDGFCSDFIAEPFCRFREEERANHPRPAAAWA
jgi:hypothetical protein